MLKKTQNNRWKLSAALAGLMLSTSAMAGTPAPTEGFDNLFDRAEDDGRCNVNVVSSLNSTFYVPSDSSNSSATFNVLVWGNGTGGTSSTYRTLLESVASQCILVAAANTEDSGTGSEMQDALNSARSRYASLIAADARVCTAGHSQGGGGSFNAANRIGADCVIPVQPDTRWTTQIYDDLDSNVEVITLWSSSDSLAPASGNRRNVEDASSILTQVETSGEGHFEPTSGRGGNIGTLFRMANIAQLSNDPATRQEFRQAFFGPTTEFTATESHSDISDVRRDFGAINTAP
ncbi:hypothetical protein KOI40_03505 [Aestuariicella sp. G3-2]|uniref:hypothetical protein n=1 Tax=Pseudomaricurvus albidus TaxID=2842452 RepID=UPI001C0AA133|nr:hypothetical protein [Aestuariicella albida]MBU3068870.1 hypothetical protein [Aestuariicella albida]